MSSRCARRVLLPPLRIASLFVASHQGYPGPDDYCEALLAYDEESGLKPSGNDRIFRSGDLVPEDLRPPWRHSVMVQPLFFKEQALGYCVIEIGSRDGSVFKTIPELISTALKAIALSHAIVDEATRRQRAEQTRMAQELEIAAVRHLGQRGQERVEVRRGGAAHRQDPARGAQAVALDGRAVPAPDDVDALGGHAALELHRVRHRLEQRAGEEQRALRADRVEDDGGDSQVQQPAVAEHR